MLSPFLPGQTWGLPLAPGHFWTLSFCLFNILSCYVLENGAANSILLVRQGQKIPLLQDWSENLNKLCVWFNAWHIEIFKKS